MIDGKHYTLEDMRLKFKYLATAEIEESISKRLYFNTCYRLIEGLVQTKSIHSLQRKIHYFETCREIDILRNVFLFLKTELKTFQK